MVHMSATAATVSAERQVNRQRVAFWLIGCAGMVFAMAVIGAITRLTESGLSMVEWRPLIGTLPPLSDAEWQRVFDLYRQTPEYRLVNAGMSLEAFREIFFWEWLHRLWGRLIGVVFAVPFLWLWLTGRIPRPLMPRLLVVLALGAGQALMGWYMVQSGLVDRPSVSQYRLAAHLGLAFLIYGLLVWLALGLLDDGRDRPAAASALRRHTWISLGIAAVTVLWGAFVAGLDAGLAYNTFPLMNGALLPPEAFNLMPAWLNAFENTALVQFIHRWLGMATAVVVLVLAWRGRLIPGNVGRLAIAAGVMALLQVALGIATLLLAVPIVLGALHQAGALVLVTLLLWLAFECRVRPAVSSDPASGAAAVSTTA